MAPRVKSVLLDTDGWGALENVQITDQASGRTLGTGIADATGAALIPLQFGLALKGLATGVAGGVGTPGTNLGVTGAQAGGAGGGAGTLGVEQHLAGEADAHAGGSVTVVGPASLSASAAGGATASGTLSQGEALTGAAAGAGTGAASAPSQAVALGGTAAGQATGTGTPSQARPLTGTAAGQATGTGTPSQARPLTGTAAAAATGAGTVSIPAGPPTFRAASNNGYLPTGTATGDTVFMLLPPSTSNSIGYTQIGSTNWYYKKYTTTPPTGLVSYGATFLAYSNVGATPYKGSPGTATSSQSSNNGTYDGTITAPAVTGLSTGDIVLAGVMIDDVAWCSGEADATASPSGAESAVAPYSAVTNGFCTSGAQSYTWQDGDDNYISATSDSGQVYTATASGSSVAATALRWKYYAAGNRQPAVTIQVDAFAIKGA